MESQEGKPHKVKFSRGYDIEAKKFRYQTGEIVNYFLGEVVEVKKTRGGALVRLYKSEYINIKS